MKKDAGGWDTYHVWRRGEVFTGFWLEGLKGRALEDLGIGERMTLSWTLGR
jgi:hypothetical protein